MWAVFAIAALAGAASTSYAQTPTDPAHIEPFRPTAPIGSPPVTVPNPIAPSGPPSGYPGLPALEPAPEGPEDFISIAAESLRTAYEDGRPARTVAKGAVRASYRDMTVTAREAWVDYRLNKAVFEENVVFRTGAQETRGGRVEIDIRTGEWRFTDADTTIRPELAKGFLQAPVFAGAERIDGLKDERVSALRARATTCDLDEPHYVLSSRSLAVYPGRWIVFRTVTPSVMGRKLFTLRRLVVPLRDVSRNPGIVPQVGSSLEEGQFVKTAFAYMGTETQSGFLTLDLMSKKGFGQGLRHSYQFSNAAGELNLYRVNDRNLGQNTLAGRYAHSQRLGTVLASVSSDFRSNSYLYAPESKSLSNRLTLTRDRGTARTSLAVNQLIDNTFTRTSRLTGSLRHRQATDSRSYLDTSFDYTGFDSQGINRARLSSQAVYSRDAGKFDWTVSAQKLTDLSDEAFVGVGGFGGVERLPEIALVSDTARLGRVLPFGIPARLKLSYGRYNELPVGTELDRTYASIETPVRRKKLSSTWSLAAGAGFRQFVYGDDTAQYTIDTSAELRKTLGEKSTLAFTYRFQRPRGFTPFRFDYNGRYNVVNASLNLQETDRFRLSVLTGYNFEQSAFPWQDIVLRAAYQPTSSLLVYAATGYDVNNSKWRTLINQVRIRAGDEFKLDIGTRYDPTTSRFSSIRTLLDTPIGPKTRVQAVAGYNGFTRAFDYRSIMLTRDLHCWEASLMFVDQGGFYRDRGVMLNFRIKAFPLFTNFGTGAFGQSLDTSVGQIL